MFKDFEITAQFNTELNIVYLTKHYAAEILIGIYNNNCILLNVSNDITIGSILNL